MLRCVFEPPWLTLEPCIGASNNEEDRVPSAEVGDVGVARAAFRITLLPHPPLRIGAGAPR